MELQTVEIFTYTKDPLKLTLAALDMVDDHPS